MRVGLIAPPWTPVPPDRYGGIELVVDRLARGFQDAGNDVILFTTGDSTSPVPRRHRLERAEGERIGYAVPEVRHVIAAYDELQGCDVIHDHTVVGPLHGLAVMPGVPIVTTIHGPLVEELREIYAYFGRAGATLLAISHAQHRAAPEIPIARVIHHGIEASMYPMGAGGGGYCLFLGRMNPDKGPHRAIEVAQKAGMPLLLAAKLREPKEIEFFEAAVRPHLGPDAEYLGEVSHEDKLDLLAGADALLFPIRWNEPFGLVMIEALACGTPVLAFPEGAAPEVVEHGVTGFLCHDEADMAESLRHVDTIDRARCRTAVEGYFSTERMVREHLALFDDLVR